MNKKCYIAGPITGLPREQYMKAFEDAEAEVRALGLEPVNPTKLPHDHPKEWAEFMREDLRALTECGHIYMLRGWLRSNGARFEYSTAKALGMPIHGATGMQEYVDAFNA
jgi:hypothetical protein